MSENHVIYSQTVDLISSLSIALYAITGKDSQLRLSKKLNSVKPMPAWHPQEENNF